MPILNSKLTYFYLKSVASTLQGGYLDFRRPYIETIPIKIPHNKNQFIIITEFLIKINNDFKDESQKFQRNLKREFSLEELSKKLQDWYLLSYADFIKELAKKKVILSLSQKAEWEEYFLSEAKKANDIKDEISKTDAAIDQMVYELYGLNEEEIKIVEGN